MKDNYRAGFIGCGNMGGVLAGVAAKSLGGERVLVADLDENKVKNLQLNFGCKPAKADDLAKNADIVVIGVKPQVIAGALAEIRQNLEQRSDYFVVSMAAGVTIESIEQRLKGDEKRPVPIIRIMPNIPCASGEGAVLYCKNDAVTKDMEDAFLETFAPSGLLMAIEEEKIDAGSAISGCGPAFVYMFIDALIDGGVRAGLPRDKARLLAEQTVLGSAKNALDTAAELSKLKADVCSPAGSTIEGVAALEKHGFRSAVIDAVMASYKRTIELGK